MRTLLRSPRRTPNSDLSFSRLRSVEDPSGKSDRQLLEGGSRLLVVTESRTLHLDTRVRFLFCVLCEAMSPLWFLVWENPLLS